MSNETRDSTKEKVSNLKCVKCQHFDKHVKDCNCGHDCKSNFTACEDFIINDKLINF